MKTTSFGRWIASKPRWIVVTASATVGALIIGGGAYAASALSEPAATVAAEPSTTSSPAPSAVASPTPSVSATSEPSPSASASSTPSPSASPSVGDDESGLSYAWPDTPDSPSRLVFEADPGQSIRPLSFSPDGLYVAVIRDSGEGAASIDFVNDATGAPTGVSLGNWFPAVDWKPSGATAVVAVSTNAGTLKVMTVDPSGGAAKTVLTKDHSWAVSIDVAPDGKHAVLVSTPDVFTARNDLNNYAITLLALDGSGSSDLGIGAGATYTPSGDDILFHGLDGGNVALYRIGAGGTEREQVSGVASDTHEYVWSAAKKVVWSPDGSLGVYGIMLDPYTEQLRSVDSDGAGDRKVMDMGNYGDDVQFSPDGSKVLAVTATTGGNEVSVVDFASGKVNRLKGETLSAGGHISAAAWLPDGSDFMGGFAGVKTGSFAFVGSTPGSIYSVGFGVGQRIDGPPLWSVDGASIYWPLAASREADGQLWQFLAPSAGE